MPSPCSVVASRPDALFEGGGLVRRVSSAESAGIAQTVGEAVMGTSDAWSYVFESRRAPSGQPGPSAARPTIPAPGWRRRPPGCPASEALESRVAGPFDREGHEADSRASQTALVSRVTSVRRVGGRGRERPRRAGSRPPCGRSLEFPALQATMLDDALGESVSVEMRYPEHERRARDDDRELPGVTLARVPDRDRRHDDERAVHRAGDRATGAEDQQRGRSGKTALARSVRSRAERGRTAPSRSRLQAPIATPCGHGLLFSSALGPRRAHESEPRRGSALDGNNDDRERGVELNDR